MKKLPSIYHTDITKNNNIDNIDNIDNIVSIKDSNKDNKEVSKKIQDLINQTTYIFNTDVLFVYSDHEEKGNIAGVINNHIITMDNNIIDINDLVDIKVLD